MTDKIAFDWVALAPLDDVQRVIADVCATHHWQCTWFAQEAHEITVHIAQIGVDEQRAFATLQDFQRDQTHIRIDDVDGALPNALPEACYAALRHEGWMPSDSELYNLPPRFFRPHGFRPRPTARVE